MPVILYLADLGGQLTGRAASSGRVFTPAEVATATI
jgi:hypothetical protein